MALDVARPPLTTTPVAVNRLSEQVAAAIALRVVRGELAGGAALPSLDDLAAQFAVSRAVVREALRGLVAAGLVEVRHGRGTSVRPREAWNLLHPQLLAVLLQADRLEELLSDLLELRRIVEVEVAGLAAERATPAQLAALEASLAEQRSALADRDRYNALDTAFHALLFEASGNALLRALLEPVGTALRLGRELSTSRGVETLPRSLAGHEEIYQAVAARQPEAARAAMQRHLWQFEADVRAALAARKGR